MLFFRVHFIVFYSLGPSDFFNISGLFYFMINVWTASLLFQFPISLLACFLLCLCCVFFMWLVEFRGCTWNCVTCEDHHPSLALYRAVELEASFGSHEIVKHFVNV